MLVGSAVNSYAEYGGLKFMFTLNGRDLANHYLSLHYRLQKGLSRYLTIQIG